RREPRAAAAHPTQSCADGDRSRQGERLTSRPALGNATRAAPALPIDERPVLADQKLEMRTLFIGELEKNLFAPGVLEFVAIALEETVRSAFALDPDHQRLTIVEAIHQPVGRRGKQPICRSLEEEK